MPIRRSALVAAILLALAAPATAHAGDMFGISANHVFNDADSNPAKWDRPLSEIRLAGIGSVRSDAFWAWAEPSAPRGGVHDYRWTMLDAEAGALARHDLEWLPVIDYSTTWASKNGSEYAPPDDPEDYASYAGAFARRYGRGGTFWAEHPELAPKPVETYEIWNEPNVVHFWRPNGDPARYAELYARARAAIRAVDPSADVIVGGIVADPGYLRAMFEARPELRGNVDGLGIHPYGATVEDVVRNTIALRQAFDSVGERGVPLHVTEIGWPTHGTGWVPPIPDELRAQALAITADGLARSDCGIASIVPYTWSSREFDPFDVQDWLGIRHPDGRQSATSLAYEQVVARWATSPPTDESRLRLCRPPPPSRDSDGDGTSNRADSDDDGDGLSDATERRLGTSSYDRDSDDDGLADGAERRMDPARPDSDGDGLPDGLERGVARPVPDPAGPVGGTTRGGPFRPDRDPRTRTRGLRRDSDRDGLRDRREDRNRNGRRDRGETDPRKRDTDGDGVIDGRDKAPLKRAYY
jgi:hypothetical protein